MTIIPEDGGAEEKNKLSGWLSVSEINENCRKLDVDGLVWKIKAVTFCTKTKQLFISSVNEDEHDYPDSPLNFKSPSLDVSSPKSETPLSGGGGARPRLDSSNSSNGLKQFFSKKLAISRSRSVGKVGTQKPESSSPKSPNALWASWRSQETDTGCLSEDVAESSINLCDPNISIIRPIHPSVLSRQYCFQVLTPFDMKYFCCRYEEEYYTWLRGLNSCVHCNRDQKIRLDTSLSVWIFEAKGVPVRKKYFCEILVDKMLFSRTTAKYKDEMLFWGEQFSFEDLPPTESVTISLFRESDTKKKRRPDKNVFVGSSVIDLVNFETNTEIERWVSIHVPGISPKLQQKTTSSSKGDTPSIRTKLKYETHVILPLVNYQKLHQYLIDNYLVLTSTLEMSINLKTKDLLAQALLKILIPSKKAESFLVDIIMNEVRNTTDENLTFRGNSLATKSIDTYMKMIGKKYIQETLVTFINSVYELEGDTEVDPQKLTTPNSSLSENQKCLVKLVEDCWRSIFLSIQFFPKNLQLVFSMVREQCELLKRDIVKKIVSASLFLRLLCPAILSPSLFLLTPEYPNEKVSRALTLVAKTIQNLANFTRFGSKEGYMEILNEFVEREMVNMDNFLQRISFEPDSIDDNETSCPACINIDVARELSVIYHLLSKEILKLSPPGASKLNDLKVILNEIRLVYESSPQADELRLCRPFASVALVCSKPLVTPTCVPREDTPTFSCGEMTPVTPMDDEDFEPEMPMSYLDTSLSLTEDYVRGCQQLQPNQGGSINESVLVHSNSNQSEILTKNTYMNSHCKCEQTGNMDFLELKTPKEMKTSKSPLTARKQKQVNRKKRVHSAESKSQKNLKEETGCTKDRANMLSKHDDLSRLKPETCTITLNMQHYDPQDTTNQRDYSKNRNLDLFQKKRGRSKTGSPLLLNIDNVEKKNTRTNIKNTEEKSSSDDGELTLDEDSSESNNQIESETSYNTKGSDYHDRSKLKLHSLQKDHCFLDELLPYNKNNKSNSNNNDNNSNFTDTFVDDISSPMLRRNACSNNSKRYTSSSEPSSACASSEHWRSSCEKDNERRPYTETVRSCESDKKNNFTRDVMVHTPDTGKISQIHSNGFYEMMEVHRNSNTSSCSSNCACSSESYYSGEEEYGTFITGERLSEALGHHNHAGSLTPSTSRRLHNSTNNSFSSRGGEAYDNTAYEDEGDVDVLKKKLRESEYLLRKTQKELKTRSENFEQTVIRLKDKLIEADKKMKAQRSDNETQMKNVISRLLNVEGELRNEHAEMEAVIKGKQKMIEIQDKRIKALEGSNIRLLRALSNMKRNHSRQEDNEIDELLQCLNNKDTATEKEDEDDEVVDGDDDDDERFDVENKDIKHV